MKTGSVIQRVALLIMVVALGVAMMACEAAAGKPGEAGKAGEAGKPGGVPPQLETPLDDVSLTDSGAAATATVNLNDHFWDPNDKDAALSYSAASDKPEVVTVAVSGSTLTLTAVGMGTAQVTVTAEDKEELTTRGRFSVTVTEAGAPMATAIPALTIYKDEGAQVVPLGMYFTHDGGAITYSASALPVGVVTVTVEGANLTVTPLVTGQARVTVIATADGKQVSSVFLVDVLAGSTPVPPPPPPPPPEEPIAPVGTVPPATVEVGKTVSANLAGYFSKTDGVTYTANSDNTVKATAAVDATGRVTITGVEAGEADVIVEATDPEGNSASHRIYVEVIDPLAPYAPSSLTIEGVGKSADVRIDDGQTLRSLNTDVVRVSGSGTAWMIEAVKKGEATVRINNANQTIAGTIMVTVENTAPMVKEGRPRVRLSAAEGAAIVGDIDPKAFSVSGGPPAEDVRWYHKVEIDFAEYFSDADGFGDIKDYNVKSLEPFVEVVGAVTDGIVLDVIKDIKFSFHVEVSAVDKDGAESDIVLISITSTAAHPDRYDVAQDLETGRFDSVKVWKRIGVTHALSFKEFKLPTDPPATDGGSAGFNFIEGFHHDLGQDEGRWFVLADHYDDTSGSERFELAADADDRDSKLEPELIQTEALADLAPSFYFVTSTDPVKSPDLSFSDPGNDPSLAFHLESNTPDGTTTATVTITYYVITCVAADLTAATVVCRDAGAGGPDYVWDSVSKTLTMNIVPSSEAYEE